MAACRDVPARALAYDTMSGSLAFRRALARFMGRTFLGREPRPEQVAVLAGAGCVLELLFHVIADPGDGVLVPTPSYAGFWPDLETRNELAIVPVHRDSGDGFRLRPERLDAALAGAGRPVRALLLTSPDNPLGRVYAPEELAALLAWGERAGVHVVLDEVYALSVFGERQFTSCARVVPALGERVHVVWAFSKDFAASGLRCGVLVTENAAVMRAVESLADWACCSGDTQHLLGAMIADDAWADGYVATMRARARRRLPARRRGARPRGDRIPAVGGRVLPAVRPARAFCRSRRGRASARCGGGCSTRPASTSLRARPVAPPSPASCACASPASPPTSPSTRCGRSGGRCALEPPRRTSASRLRTTQCASREGS